MKMRICFGLLGLFSTAAVAADLEIGDAAEIKRETWACDWQARRELDNHMSDRDTFRRALMERRLAGRCTPLQPGTKLVVTAIKLGYAATEVWIHGTDKRLWVTTPVLHENSVRSAVSAP